MIGDFRFFFSASLRADALRFLLAGGLNTLLTLGLYQFLLFVLPHLPAYALAWVAGVAFVMIVYPSRVFQGGRTKTRDRLAIGASYVGVFFVGLACLEVLIRLGLQPRIGIIIVLVVTTAASFAAGRLIARR